MSKGVTFGRRQHPQWCTTVLGYRCERAGASDGLGHQPPGSLSPLSAHPGQVHGPLLRLNQVSPADSGEYSCRVASSSGTLEASVLVTIEASSPGPIPGE